MKVARVLSVGRIDEHVKGIDLTRPLTGSERVSMVEDLRREVAKVTGGEYPCRLERVLEIVRRDRC